MKRFVVMLFLVGCTEKQPPPDASAPPSPSPSASASASASPFASALPSSSPYADLSDLLAEGGAGRPGSLSGLNGLPNAPNVPSAKPDPSVRGTCTLSPAKASLPIADADRVMTTLRPRLERVYESNLQIDPNMEGTLDYDVKVTPTGEVGSVAGKPTGLSGATQGAMLQVIRSAHFAAPHGLSVLTGTITCKRKT